MSNTEWSPSGMKPEEPVDWNAEFSRDVSSLRRGLISAGIGLGIFVGLPAYQAWAGGRAFGVAMCDHYQPGLTFKQTFQRLSLSIDNDPSIKKTFDYPERFEDLAFDGFDSGLAQCDMEFDLRAFYKEHDL